MDNRELIRPANGEPVGIPLHGPVNPRQFTTEEREKVVTFLDFDLPYALEGIQGSMEQKIPFFTSGDTNITFLSSQKACEDIRASLHLSFLTPPKSGVIVSSGDRYGRINFTAIQFQIKSFVDLNESDGFFDRCLSCINDFIDHYRRAKQDYAFRKVNKDDIFAYHICHHLNDDIYNDLIQPIAHLTLRALPNFPDDMYLWNKIWFDYVKPVALWDQLIHEAHYYLSLGDYHVAIINAITALENVIKDDKIMKVFFQRHNIPFDRWKDTGNRESLTQRLYLLRLLCNHLKLDSDLIDRIIEHYNIRNDIVHRGIRPYTNKPEKVQNYLNDIHQLIRIILDEIHLSIILGLTLLSFPSQDAEFGIINFSNPKDKTVIKFLVKRQYLCSEIQSNDQITAYLQMDLQNIGWEIGSQGTIKYTYDAHQKISKLIFNNNEIDHIESDLGVIDASLFEPQAQNLSQHSKFIVVEWASQYNRVIQPHELNDDPTEPT